MAFKRKPLAKKTYRRRRAYRRRGKKGAPSTAIIRAPVICPDRYFCKLKYTPDAPIVHVTTTTCGTYVYRGNDLYDPDYSGAGHQPLGFDQLMSLYSKFVVMGSKIEMRFCQVAGNSIVSVRPQPDVTAPISIELEPEKRRTKYRWLASGGRTNGRLVSYMSTARQFGVMKSKVFCEDSYSGTASASPANVWYWMIGDQDPSGTSQTIHILPTITFYCCFYSRLRLTQS